MATRNSMVEVIKSYRRVYDQENQHLTQKELDDGFKRHWISVSAQVLGGSRICNILPHKRSSSKANVGVDSPSKRPGHDSTAVSVPSSHYLERQASAPAGRASKSSQSAMRPTQMTTSVGPISIPSHQQTRRASTTAASYSRSFNRPILARSPEDYPTPAISLSTSPAVERAFGSPDGKLSPATSETSLTSASTVYSEPMTRSNTNDVLCTGFDMIRMDSVSYPEQYESGLAKATDVEHDQLFSLSHDTPAYHDFSFSVAVDSFSYGSEMKHSLSQDSNTSSQSVTSDSHFVRPTISSSSSSSSPPTTNTTSSSRAQELRRLEPKQNHDAAAFNSRHHPSHLSSPEPKLVERTLEDGTKVMKAEISRAARQQPPRKTTFCPHCRDQPLGFHGEHELNRHIDRQHRHVRKVWICKDISANGFLEGCKACRNSKTYGANYNAAAHLRRAHFNPCKNKRGGRGKKSEGRGGMGGGNKPSMDELKGWMFAMYEIFIDGKVVEMRPVPPEGQEDAFATQVVPVAINDMGYAAGGMEMQAGAGAGDDFDFEYSPPAEQFLSSDMGMSVSNSMPHGYTIMAPANMQTMHVPAQHYGQVNYMQMQQPIYIN